MTGAVRNRYLEIKKQGLSTKDIKGLRKALTLKNPAHKHTLQMTGQMSVKISPFIQAYEEDDTTFYVPRHFDQTEEFENLHITLDITEKKGYIINREQICWRPDRSMRDYQVKPVSELTPDGQILHAPCGSGKTTMAIRMITELGVKTAIVVDTDILVDQWRNRLLFFTDLKEEDIGLVGDGKTKDGKVVICFIQSLLRKTYGENKQFYDSFPLVVIDECHGTGSSEFFKVLNRFPGRRVGLTATINRTDKLKTFIWSIGSRVVTVEVDMLKPNVYMLPSETDLEYRCRYYRNMNTVVLGRLLVKDWKRNKRIKDFIQLKLNAGRNVIILTCSRENAKYFFDTLECPRKALLLGQTDKKNETQRVDHEDPQLICATFTFLAKGFDNDKMDAICYVTPFNSKVTVEQSAGRIVRFREGKATPEIYDIYDPKTSVSLDSAVIRLAHYKSLNYKIIRGIENAG